MLTKHHNRKGGIVIVQLPWLVLIMILIIVVVALLAYIKTASIIYADKNRLASDALYAMLNSNECTPNTKVPLKDVLGIGIGEGMKMSLDKITVNYGGKTDDVSIGPSVFSAGCIPKLVGRTIPAVPYQFYVEYSSCPVNPSNKAIRWCFVYGDAPNGMKNVPLTIETVEYIALPNGDTAKAVLKTAG